LISRAGVTADASDAEGNLLPGIPELQDIDNANVLEASIDIESTVVEGENADCAEAVELVEVVPGDVVTFCYEVTNSGNTVLRVETVTDDVLGIEIPVPAASQRLGINDSFVVSISLPAEGEVTNIGDVAGTPLGFDDEPLLAPEVIDEDDAAVVILSADLSIVKDVSDNGPVPAGSVLTYTLVVSNTGPNEAREVKVTDDLPLGLNYLSVPSADGWVCALDGDNRGFACLKSTAMAADDSATLTYRVAAAGAASGTSFRGVGLTNTATVSSVTPDPDPTNNTDIETTRIQVPSPPRPPQPPIAPEIVPPAPPLARCCVSRAWLVGCSDARHWRHVHRRCSPESRRALTDAAACAASLFSKRPAEPRRALVVLQGYGRSCSHARSVVATRSHPGECGCPHRAGVSVVFHRYRGPGGDPAWSRVDTCVLVGSDAVDDRRRCRAANSGSRASVFALARGICRAHL